MKEVTEWNGKPRMMWVWNDNTDEKQKEKVIYICSGNYLKYNVMTVIENDDYETFQHCAEIEESKETPKTESKGYYVYCRNASKPTYIHPTLELAQAEAERLSRLNPDKIFEVLEIVGRCRAETKIKWE